MGRQCARMIFMKVYKVDEILWDDFLLFFIRYSKGQGRIDGAFCEFTAEEKMKFLEHCSVNGIKNIEMESLCFTGLLNHAKLRGFQLYYNHLKSYY